MRRRALALAIYGLLGLVTLLPVLAVQVPALGDTINHIARMHILAEGAGSPLDRFYTVRWTLSPYLAMDAVVPILARFMPLMIAARVFIGACILMPVAAAAMLRRVAIGRVGLVPAAGFLLGQNTLLSLGFLNFLFMAGFSVMLFAAWIATRDRPPLPRIVLFAAALLLLYLGHVFAAIGYCLAVAGFEIAHAMRCRFQPWRAVALTFLGAGAQALPALLLTPFFDRGQVALGGAVTAYGSLAVRLTALASPVLFLADPVNAAVVLAVAAGIILLALRTRLRREIWPSAAVLAAASLALPHQLAGVWGADLRLPLIACMFALGGASVRLSPRTGRIVLGAIALLTLAKSLDSTIVLRQMDARIAQTRRVLATMPRGSRLLVMDDTGLTESEPALAPNAFWHIPLMAVIDRDAFVPYLFTGFMTVHPTAAVTDATTPSGRPIDAAQLSAGLDHPERAGEIIPDGTGGRVYWNDWPHKFDFLLVQHAGHRTPLPPVLQLVAASEVADLYRITPATAPGPSPPRGP